MRSTSLVLIVALFGLSSGLLLGACGDDGTAGPHDAGDAGDAGDVGDTSLPAQPDEDGDGISDLDEGRGANRDSDGDGTPDYLDTDSDDDTIPDSVEAGDADTHTPPEDVDMDGLPNYIDDDSDGNGILDIDEGVDDPDGDGRRNFRDTDDDDDHVDDVTEVGDPASPADFDGDGIPDFRDADSDGDNLLDGDERPRAGDAPDLDGDGTPDWQDDDSDGDGISDLDEAGDVDVRTPPLDTDEDGTPNFRDTDSDNDGISDADELAAGTNPILEDTDGDEVGDLVELAGGTDPLDPFDNPRERGDFVFIVPYEAPPMPQRDTLRFRTNIQFADIYFVFDESGSMAFEINALQMAVNEVITDLTCMDFGTSCTRDSMCGTDQICSIDGTCLEDPSVSSCVASPWTGVGKYEENHTHITDIQPDPLVTAAGLMFGTRGGTERLNRSAWCIADPAGCGAFYSTTTCMSPLPSDRVGCPGFRKEAVKILVMVTDEESSGLETAEDAGRAVSEAGINFLGVWSSSPSSYFRHGLEDLAIASGSLDRAGEPLVFDGHDAMVVPAITDAINEIVQGVPLRVTIGAVDQPDDAGDALQFIRHLQTNATGRACSILATEDSDGDGIQDTFPSVIPGIPICYDIVAEENTTVPPELSPLIFEALVTVYGDGSPLDNRRVFFLVPPTIPGAGGPD